MYKPPKIMPHVELHGMMIPNWYITVGGWQAKGIYGILVQGIIVQDPQFMQMLLCNWKRYVEGQECYGRWN